MQDIAHEIGLERVAAVVDRFYDDIQHHPTLGPVFQRVHDWPTHMQHLTHFWWVTLGGPRYLDYRYEVARKHHESGFTPALLADWLTLFRCVLTDMLDSDLAQPWLKRAELIGQSLTHMHGFQPRPVLATDAAARPA